MDKGPATRKKTAGGGGGGSKLNDSLDNSKETPQKKVGKAGKDDESTKVCEFCGKFNKDFTDSNKLDIHLWKECPMLTTC